MKLLLWLLATPQILASLLLEIFAPQAFRVDLAKCVALAIRNRDCLPASFLEALRIAEDHRNPIHPGIDGIAILRATWVSLATGKTQGASTIDQQFVRVVTSRYERTLARKIREQMLALTLRRRVCRKAIASAYLSVAFYGSAASGVSALNQRFGSDLSGVSFRDALRMVAQLKYPSPEVLCLKWQSKLEARYQSLLVRAVVQETRLRGHHLTRDRAMKALLNEPTAA